MKHFLSLANDYILKTENSPVYVDGKIQHEGTKNNSALCYEMVQNVMFYLDVYSYADTGSSYSMKVFIPKQDIIDLAEKIKEIEEAKPVFVPLDDLPY